jgi:hypothetical protein
MHTWPAMLCSLLKKLPGSFPLPAPPALQLSDARAEMGSNASTAAHAAEQALECARQRQRVLRSVLDLLPLTLLPPDDSGCAAWEAPRVCVGVAGWPLPGGRDLGWPSADGTDARHLGTTLGAAALLLDLLGQLFELPLPARFGHRGSTSRIWQPASFEDWSAASLPKADLPLYAAPRAEGAALYLPGGGAAAEAVASCHRRKLREACYLLQRCAGMLTQAVAAGAGASALPQADWPPLARLAALCTLLGGEAGVEGGGSMGFQGGEARSMLMLQSFNCNCTMPTSLGESRISGWEGMLAYVCVCVCAYSNGAFLVSSVLGGASSLSLLLYLKPVVAHPKGPPHTLCPPYPTHTLMQSNRTSICRCWMWRQVCMHSMHSMRRAGRLYRLGGVSCRPPPHMRQMSSIG